MAPPPAVAEALEGRMSPAVVDAFVAARLARRRDPYFSCLTCAASRRALSGEGAAQVMASVARSQRVLALPCSGGGDWTLLLLSSSSMRVLLRRGADASGASDTALPILPAGAAAPGDGGQDMLAWIVALCDGETPRDGARLDTLTVRLELMVLRLEAPPEPPGPQKPPESAAERKAAVIAADLASALPISDDTVDVYTARLQERVPRASCALLPCAEVKSWAAAATLLRGESEEWGRAFRAQMAATLAGAQCTAMPLHTGGHWVLLVHCRPSGAFYALDSSPGGGGPARALADACRHVAPAECAGMRLVHVCVPQQRDSYSCGLFVLAYCEALVTWFEGGGGAAGWSEAAPAPWATLRAVDTRALRERIRIAI